MAEISRDALDAAERRLDAAKAAYLAARNRSGLRAWIARRRRPHEEAALRAVFEAAKANCTTIRQAWREQETAAGRRRGLVGGDALAERSI